MSDRAASTPLRGTQSLVGVMGFVWRHPSLTVLEVLWRWLAAAPLLWLAWLQLGPTLARVAMDQAALEGMTFFEPARSAAVLTAQARLYLVPAGRVAVWWVPLALLVWAAAAAVGRTAILRRAVSRGRVLEAGVVEADVPGHGPRTASFGAQALRMGWVSAGRALLFLALLALWWRGVLGAVRLTVISPAQSGGEPNLVLLTAVAVGLTLAAFFGWSLVVWGIDLIPLAAFTPDRLKTPVQRAYLRSKLIETNLVMGVVRVALLVLGMTFSASPLPFQTQETQAFIDVWWLGVGVFYLVSSDFFHVVRRVTYLRLLESVAAETNGATTPAS